MATIIRVMPRKSTNPAQSAKMTSAALPRLRSGMESGDTISVAVMSPHPQDENFFLIREDFVNDPMLEIDPPRETSGQLTA